MIATSYFSKDESIRSRRGFDLKRNGLGELHPTCATRAGDAVLHLVHSARANRSKRAMAQHGGHAAFIEADHPDRARRYARPYRRIFGRYFDGIALRHVD